MWLILSIAIVTAFVFGFIAPYLSIKIAIMFIAILPIVVFVYFFYNTIH